MSDFYCPRCGRKSILDTYCKLITTPASGPFIVGHIGGDPNLPMIGAPLNAGTSRLGQFCKTCGEEGYILETPEEIQQRKDQLKQSQEESNKLDRIVGFLILVVILFLALYVASYRSNSPFLDVFSATCLGIAFGWIVRYFIHSRAILAILSQEIRHWWFKESGRMLVGSVVTIILGGAVIKFLDRGESVAGVYVVESVFGVYVFGVVLGFVIHHIVFLIKDYRKA